MTDERLCIGSYAEYGQAAIAYAAAHGSREITLSAQHTARRFYEKLGFAQCGESVVFESGFILIPMQRML